MSVHHFRPDVSLEGRGKLQAVPPLAEEPNRELLAPKEQELLTNFFGYCQEVVGIDARRADHSASPEIALAAHDFISGAVRRRLEALQPKEEEGSEPQAPPFFAIPQDPIKRRIREYYAEFGTTRRQKSELLLEKEEAHLERSMVPLGQQAIEKGKRVPRIDGFPEVELTYKLRDLLASQKHDVAADSAEVVLAAYGQWFLNLAGYAGRRVIDEDMYRDSHNVVHWRRGDSFQDS